MITDSKDIATLVSSITDAVPGLKAETVVANIVAGGFPREDFIIRPERFFERAYIQDIAGSSILEKGWADQLIQLRLSRPGFYDMLPEGLFFQPGGAEYNSTMGVSEMAAIYRKNKLKEKGIRNFFQPFEHAGFYQQLQLEEEEQALLRGLEQKALHQYFRAFWDIPGTISDVNAGYLITLIPYVHRICGNIPLMQACLQLLLQEEVVIDLLPSPMTPVGKEMEQGLGQQSLGENMVCGNWFMEAYPVYRYTIGPLNHERIGACLPGGEIGELIEIFNRFFVPIEAVAGMKIEIREGEAGMKLEEGREPILGYSSILPAA